MVVCSTRLYEPSVIFQEPDFRLLKKSHHKYILQYEGDIILYVDDNLISVIHGCFMLMNEYKQKPLIGSNIFY